MGVLDKLEPGNINDLINDLGSGGGGTSPIYPGPGPQYVAVPRDHQNHSTPSLPLFQRVSVIVRNPAPAPTPALTSGQGPRMVYGKDMKKRLNQAFKENPYPDPSIDGLPAPRRKEPGPLFLSQERR